MKYLVKCNNCGTVTNTSQIICDICSDYITEIELGGTWYSTDELDEDNPYIIDKEAE